MKKHNIVVIGAGMVGVCSALALQKRGFQVLLLDKQQPGSETSFGNAGMITPSSLIPFNNPKIFAALPSFLTNRTTGLRYNRCYLLSEIRNMLKFLSFSSRGATDVRIQNLFELIERSTHIHKTWCAASNQQEKLRATGWLKLYRTSASFAKSSYEQDIYRDYGISIRSLDQTTIHHLEPGLKDIYLKGLHVEDALSVAAPGELVQQYFDDFVSCGGEFSQVEASAINVCAQGFTVETKDSASSIATEQLVIAAGPWSKALLQSLGLNLPMIYERGGHRQFTQIGDKKLTRAIHDVDGSFVATPNDMGVRVTCGVELQRHLAKNNPTQLDLVTHNASQGLYINEHFTSQWFGARPTMPDSLPVIGESKLKGLWLNTGHQHIGFSTATGSAEILAKLLLGESETLAEAFSASRFNI